MAFSKIDQRVPNFPELEKQMLELWKDRDVFHRTLNETAGKPEFVFYEGPPTANGVPHNGHVLTRVIKDLFPRYMTMRGYHVERRAGWDTHGLPVEVEVEKELRISGKDEILEYGVDRFCRKCLESVFRYTEEWEHLTERIGFWVDLDKAYVTFHKSYVESVWWALSQLFAKGLLYSGHKVVWWWAQGGTALSSGEVGNSYKKVNDPALFLRCPLRDEEATLVVWTTTPWTLSSNMFIAVHGELEYAYVKDGEERLIVAKDLVASLSEKLKRALPIEKTVKGSDLYDKRYVPPFDAYAKEIDPEDDRYWRVVPGDKATGGPPQWFVTLEAGTGLVHLAPAFGEDDWKVWRNEKRDREQAEGAQRAQGGRALPDRDPGAIEMLCAVRPDGTFSERMGDLEGMWVKDADRILMRDLKERGLMLHAETYRHDYPFCWRSENDPLIQYARQTWFIKTTALIDQVIENNQEVAWSPEHVQEGRFGDFLAGNVDWALSRERFWGTPLNIWICEKCGHAAAPASCSEIESRNPDAFSAFFEAQKSDDRLTEDLMVHKPWIDLVTLPCEQCDGTMHRVPEVIDCWFDSGCMPFAQLGYPHVEGSKQAFERAFPADFISEAIDQTRGWFYSLMMISSLVFEEQKTPHPYKRCIVLGHVLDRAGKKESKSIGNYTPPEVILDAVRMAFAPISSKTQPEEGIALIGKEDLEGLDLKAGSQVTLRSCSGIDIEVTLRVLGKLPRRVLVLSNSDLAALSLEHGPSDVLPAEVPKLPDNQRVLLEYEGMPAPGADAFRWFFYASNPPWNNTRHSLSNVRGLQKELPIKLRNVFSFFVTYANIDHFDPIKDEGHKRPTADRALLDRWILSELEKTKRSVVAAMDEFRSYDATQVLTEFVEGLSNWYVRRSRGRFWAEGREQDKVDAYWTLYQCLRDFSVLIAPFLPFAAEDMYQNLVVDQYGEGPPNSVHLRLYPEGDGSRIDEALSRDMKETRALVSLGLQVRAKVKIRIRQPLREAKIVLSDRDREEAIASYASIMSDELNVRSVKLIEKADDFVTYKVGPNFQALGRRLGKKMKATQKAISSANPVDLLAQLDQQGQVELMVDGEAISLDKDDLQVVVEAKEGFAAAGSSVGVVILDTKLDDDLVDEGLFREVLSKVQGRRKDLQLDYAARIRLSISGAERLIRVCRARSEELKKETLATDLLFDGEAVGGEAVSNKVDGLVLTLEIAQVPPPRGSSLKPSKEV